MGRNRVPPKATGKRRMDEEESTIQKPKGCPCPGMKGCLIGSPVSSGDDSLTLICSAVSCPFSDMPIHKQCFEKYEDQLIRTLGEKGSARGWTEYKARRNLWKPCGQGLIVMHCRCICEKGNVRPPEDVILAERILVSPLDGDRKKKTKKRDLPIINMNGGANAKQARMQARFEREEMIEEERNLGREFATPPFTPRRTRNNSVTSYSSQSIISTSSNTRTAVSSSFVQDEGSPLLRGRDSQTRRGGRKREESRTRLDSGVSLIYRTPPTSPIKECKIPLIPAVTPPPMMRSYAATTATLPSKVSTSSSSISLPTVITPSAPSLLPSNSLVKLGENTLMPETWYTQSSIGWEIVSHGLYDPAILQSHETSEPKAILEWNPWAGQDFDLGGISFFGEKLLKS